MNMDRTKRILIWGTGEKATELCENGVFGNIVGFVETKKNKKEFKSIPVYDIDESWPEHDFVIVATVHSGEIYEECTIRRIPVERFVFLYPVTQIVGETRADILRDILSEKNYIEYCERFGLFRETFYMKDFQEYREKNTRKAFDIRTCDLWPVISDKFRKAGTTGNYFWQDLWAAQLIHKSGVRKHLDIGSRIDGFIGHLLAMGIEVSIIDVRDFPANIENLHTIVDDATSLRQISDESIESMSALCSLEHFGLGRYGDPIDPEACFKCFENIQRKMKRGGRLYLSLPVGRERLEFNAHRIFYPSTVVDCFQEMDLKEFSCTSQGTLEHNVDIHQYDKDCHNGEWRYGLFYFIKR